MSSRENPSRAELSKHDPLALLGGAAVTMVAGLALAPLATLGGAAALAIAGGMVATVTSKRPALGQGAMAAGAALGVLAAARLVVPAIQRATAAMRAPRAAAPPQQAPAQTPARIAVGEPNPGAPRASEDPRYLAGGLQTPTSQEMAQRQQAANGTAPGARAFRR